MSLRTVIFLLTIGVAAFCVRAQAQTTYTSTTVADAFLATGSPDNPVGTDLTNDNFGGAGILAISPASADKGQFQSVLEFNFADAVALFNSAYGSNNWAVTGITLTLASNYGVAGVQPKNKIFNVVSAGNFVIKWLSDTNWVEGTGNPGMITVDGVAFGDLPELLSDPCDILCTNTYTPPGNNIPVTYTLPLDTNLVTEVVSGVNATLLFYAADNQIGYLFNSHEFGGSNVPLINVTATLFMEILSSNFTNGVFSLTALGSPNSQYQIQANSDLTTSNWQTLGTVTADANGNIQFTDTTATNQQRFYRLSESF